MNFKRIIARRDARYDGQFYYGVKTTGIYCRPICPAKPKPENILVFKTPSQAEGAGFRACKRCRPELAPGRKKPDESLSVVARALKTLQKPSDDKRHVSDVAKAVGVTDRHLRRLFLRHLGASPQAVILQRRLRQAKRLIEKTDAPITQVAFAVGFHSVRRFNEAFKRRYRATPSEARS